MGIHVKKYFSMRVDVILKEFNMKAWRNLGGNVVEIEVDIGKNGQPILPPDTTVAIRPEAQEGHYVTVVGNEWVQIPIPVSFVSFETKKQQKLDELKAYREWYLEQPVEHNGVMFDGDEQARNRLIQALVIYQANAYLPPAWISFDNTPVALTTVDDLTGIIASVQTAFSTRFFETDAVRQQLIAAADEAALEAVVMPTKPSQF